MTVRKEKKMRTCDICGANLDPQEKCNCREEKENVKTYTKAKEDKSGTNHDNVNRMYIINEIRRLKAEINGIHC